MMDQFEVLVTGHSRWLTIVNTTQYDKYLGFRILIKRLGD